MIPCVPSWCHNLGSALTRARRWRRPGPQPCGLLCWGWPGCHSHSAGLLGALGRGPSRWPPGIMAMVAFDQGSRAVVKRPSLRDSGAIPVQCHVALRGTGGIFANPSGREGGRVCCMRVSAGRRPYVLIVNPGLGTLWARGNTTLTHNKQQA